jgi:hypothetical protein
MIMDIGFGLLIVAYIPKKLAAAFFRVVLKSSTRLNMKATSLFETSVKVKVKQSHYRSWQALSVPGG